MNHWLNLGKEARGGLGGEGRISNNITSHAKSMIDTS